MPQEHPARSIFDALGVVDLQGRPPPAELLARVRAVHEGKPLPGQRKPITPGWGAPYDPAVAARPVLRSQTTAVSARFLAGHPRPPFRMFCLDRNFRRESLDATHHIEFGQCEGIVGQEGITLRHLVGLFQSLAEAIGVRELKIRPSYFPFTEPSIEGYVKHPRLGWIEVFPGGLFRPEVLQPLGVDVPVAAWGIGSTRLAMVALGVNDIRDLYLDDLDRLTAGRL
jgi:phenylalanyl-tRNA synthetase alpha chain